MSEFASLPSTMKRAFFTRYSESTRTRQVAIESPAFGGVYSKLATSSRGALK